MPLSFDTLTEILKELGVAYWTSPDRPALMFSTVAKSNRRYMISASLDGDGAFLQLRSVEYNNCPVEHRHFEVVAQLLLELNYHYRGVKFSLDTRDGEIACFSDLLLFDGEATQTQVVGLIGFFLDIIDTCQMRIRTTIETGLDPGEQDDEVV